MVSLCSLNLYFSPERGGVFFHMFKSHFNFFFMVERISLFFSHFSMGLLLSCFICKVISLLSVIYVANIFVQFGILFDTSLGIFVALQNLKNFGAVKFNQIYQPFHVCLLVSHT